MEFTSSEYSEAFKKFADWIESTEKRLDSCHCCPQAKRQSSNEIPAAKLCNGGAIRETVINEDEEDGTSAIATTNEAQPKQQLPKNITVKEPITNNHGSHTKNLKQVSPTTTVTSPINNNSKDSISSQAALEISTRDRKIFWKHVIQYHQNLQNEVEDFGKQLNCELKRHLNEDKSCTKQQWDDAAALEQKWHKLWLKSLEQLVIVERTRRCPKHNSTIIGKPTPSPANKGTARPPRIRPISYPNNVTDRLEWDYRHTLSLTGCHKENGSQIDLDSVDEQVTKNLTEFGENYELWFGKEDEIACVAMHSRPASVEPTEKPEIAKAVVTSDPNQDVNCNLLMLTTPSSMFSVDANKCPHNQKHSYFWRVVGLVAVIVFIFSIFYQEPHHMHKSYYHTQPPV